MRTLNACLISIKKIRSSKIKSQILTPLSLFLFVTLLTACTVMPKSITVSERYSEAQKNVAELFGSEASIRTLTYEEALARGIRYNFDYRIKLVNSALQAGQLSVAEYTMFPDIKTTASLYTRNNDYATFGITASGQPTGVLTSTPRTLRSMREGLTWNILDFGMGYVRAQQQGNRVLIAEEESRKQLQLLAQDIRVSYWKAYSAQKLLQEAEELQKVLDKTEQRMQAAIRDKLVPKEEIYKFRNSLLGGDRQLLELTQKLEKAMLDLKHLLNLPLDTKLVLKAPPASITRIQNLSNLDFKKLDAITLIMRPELRSQNYMERIAKLGVKAAILQVFPGITLNDGYNYNSNKFLINTVWLDKSIDVSWGLLSLVSLPTAIDSAKTQIKYEELKSMALTLGVLTQTRYAYTQYSTLAKEYVLAKKQAENSDALYKLALNRNIALLASKQDVVYAKLQSMIAKMDRDLILADLSTALGELYLSAGFDVLPVDAYNKPISVTLDYIKNNFDMQSQQNFTNYVNITYDRLMRKAGDIAPTPSKPLAAKTIVENTPETQHKVVTTPVAPAPHISDNKLYTLQLFGSYNHEDAAKMKASLSKTHKNIYAGCSKFNGRDWYVVTYGTYTSASQAKSSLAELPKAYQTSGAFVRNTQELTWNGCEPSSSKLMTAVKKSFKKNVAVNLVKSYHHYATNVYKKIMNTLIA